jgi:hypothetical protein
MSISSEDEGSTAAMSVKIKGSWLLGKERLDKLVDWIGKHVSSRVEGEVCLTLVAEPLEGYVAKIQGDARDAEVTLNVAHSTRIEGLFRRGWMESIIEHEAAHLELRTPFAFDRLAPPLILNTLLGRDTYLAMSEMITASFHDALSDIYAIGRMKRGLVVNYLEYLTDDLQLAWDMRPKGLTLKIIIIMQLALVELCAEMLSSASSHSTMAIRKAATVAPDDQAIYTQVKNIYKLMWDASQRKQDKHPTIDLYKETYVLHELILQQIEPLI